MTRYQKLESVLDLAVDALDDLSRSAYARGDAEELQQWASVALMTAQTLAVEDGLMHLPTAERSP